MKTFIEAMEVLVRFDRRHWEHADGGPTVRHTWHHLDISLPDILEEVFGASTKTEWNHKRERITGLLTEHALRLARTAALRFPDCVTHGVNETRWLSYTYHRRLSFLRRAETSQGQLLELKHDLELALKPWKRWIERWEHPENAGMYPDEAAFTEIVEQLLYYAVWFGPENAYDDPGMFFEPFEERIERLSKEQGYRDANSAARVS